MAEGHTQKDCLSSQQPTASSELASPFYTPAPTFRAQPLHFPPPDPQPAVWCPHCQSWQSVLPLSLQNT